MSLCSYNCSELGTHEKLQCGQWKFGGIASLAIIECDHTVTDWTNAAQWLANIASGKIKLIESGVKGELPAASPVEGENPNCGAETILDTFDWVLNISDFNVTSSNQDLYQSINERDFYVAWALCSGDEVWVNDTNPANAVAVPLLPMNTSEKRKYEVSIRWRGREFPEIYSSPAGVFNQ